MCGIFGYNGKANPTLEKDFFLSLAHRGPDAQEAIRVDNWTLGHLRLSIIDTSNGANQPFHKDEGWIIFNGEIYNYLELQEQYLKDVPLKTHGDTEVLLELLNRHGIQVLHKLNGMFAFAWYDGKTKKLWLCRDRFGVKPLHFCMEDGQFYFSSEIKPLIKIKKKFTFNHRVLRSFFNDTATDYNHETFVEDIWQIEAGHVLSIDENGVQESIKWYQGTDHQFDKEMFKNKEQTLSYFENLLTDAIKLRHRSDVPVCITLSGGLDSTTIYVLAKEKLSSQIKPFIFAHSGSSTDESVAAMALTSSYNDTPVIITSAPSSTVPSLEEALHFLEFPIWNPSAVAYIDMYKAIKKAGYTVVIEGHGSDEQLGGYPYMIEAAFKESFLKGQFKKALMLYRLYKATINPSLDDKTPAASEEKLPSEVFQIMRGVGRGIVKSLIWPSKAKYLNFQTLINESFSYKILPIVLRTFDRLSMSQSLESRSPFMDFRVVEFIKALPSEYKVNEIGSKAILREILKKYNKEYIYTNKKKMGFASDIPKMFNEVTTKQYFTEAINAFDLPEFAAEKGRALEHIKKEKVGWSDITPIWKVAGVAIIKKMYAR